jgi:drug/metabolite transporter (DMT)-like permease
MPCSLSDAGWLTFLLRRWFPAGLKWPLVKLVVPVALFDFGDKWFQLFGIKGAGSGLYIVIFSSLTVWTALIRRVGFGRKLEWTKWAAVAMITIGLAVDSINVVVEHPVKCDKDGEPVQDRVDMTLIFGMLAALTCAMFDAAMCV